jgi:hypothetical protein
LLSAQGLEADRKYFLEGIMKGGEMNTLPIDGSAANSKFIRDMHGNGLYWYMLISDPRTA